MRAAPGISTRRAAGATLTGMTEQPANSSGVSSVDTNVMPWGTMRIEELKHDLPVKVLVDDPDTGMSVLKIVYEAGFTNTWHTHTCAHGMYVLDGVLQTHTGSYGPGSFVWFPEGEVMFHGATTDNDVTILFITNKPFDIHFQEQPPS